MGSEQKYLVFLRADGNAPKRAPIVLKRGKTLKRAANPNPLVVLCGAPSIWASFKTWLNFLIKKITQCVEKIFF
jgi:hypothetical protein